MAESPMTKPVALTDSELEEQLLRVNKGWVVKYDVMKSLIAMARERNAYVRAAEDQRVQQAIAGAMM
jgi:hypothetical protein